jgi:ABC-type transport system involved in multi-copper enzyme maturation permease subunit
MVAKEFIEARWKAVIGLVLGLATVLLGAFGFELLKSALSPEQVQSIGNALGPDIAARFSNYGNFVWGQTFSPSGNNGVIMFVVAAMLGSTAIAGEVSKGTIFLLLSRPLSRDNILLTKYWVGAAMLLAMLTISGVVLAIATAIEGDPQNLGGIAISVLLYWLGTLFVFGMATLFSVVFNDVLRPLALSLGIVLVLSLPGFLPNLSGWVLPGYWSSLPAFLGQEFPLKAILISTVSAIIPTIAAVLLFRRQAY